MLPPPSVGEDSGLAGRTGSGGRMPGEGAEELDGFPEEVTTLSEG